MSPIEHVESTLVQFAAKAFSQIIDLQQLAAAKVAKGQRCTERRRPDYIMRQVACSLSVL